MFVSSPPFIDEIPDDVKLSAEDEEEVDEEEVAASSIAADMIGSLLDGGVSTISYVAKNITLKSNC